MPQEIRPDNPFGLYEPFVHAYSLNYVIVVVFVNTATDFENYHKPITRALGINQEIALNMDSQIKVTVTFEQLNVRTYDGFLKRNMSENRKMQYRDTSYKTTKRSPTDKFILVELKMSDDVMLVERVYPTFIDLLSDIGAILKTLAIVCVTVAFAHNQLLFDKYLLNAVFTEQ